MFSSKFQHWGTRITHRHFRKIKTFLTNCNVWTKNIHDILLEDCKCLGILFIYPTYKRIKGIVLITITQSHH